MGVEDDDDNRSLLLVGVEDDDDNMIVFVCIYNYIYNVYNLMMCDLILLIFD